MSFEKKMKKRGNQKLNAFAKNPYHKPKTLHIPLWTKVLVPSLALSAGLVLFVTLGVLPNVGNKATEMNKGGEPAYSAPTSPASADKAFSEPKDYSYSPTSPSTPEEGQAYRSWDERIITEQYPYVDFSEKTYSPYSKEKAAPIAATYIKEKAADDVVVDGYDNLQGNGHTTKASIYYIKNVSEEAAIAVQFEGTSDYYAYLRLSYTCTTFDELYDQLGFASELVIESVSYNDNEGAYHNDPIKNQDNLNSLLASYKGINNIWPNDPNVPTDTNITFIELIVSLPSLDIKQARIEFYNYGLVSFRFSFNMPIQFEIGVDNYNTFKDAAIEATK